MLSTILRLADGTTVVLADALEGDREYRGIVLHRENPEPSDFTTSERYRDVTVTESDIVASQELSIADEQMAMLAETAVPFGPFGASTLPAEVLGYVLVLADGTTVVLADVRDPGDWYRGIIVHGVHRTYRPFGADLAISENDIAKSRLIVFTDENAAALAAGKPVHGKFETVEEMVARWTAREPIGGAA